MTEQQTHWQNVKQQAIDGDLQIDYDAGSALRNECEVLLTQLLRFRDDTASLGHLAGYGGLPSALDIQRKFELKASGAENGDSAVARLDGMIEVVTLMRDTYAAMIGELQETDQQNSSQTAAAGEGLR
ncbi:hypothetical protein NLM24_10145 [Nocardia zapadnayensis]|uniref:hypothetical protein n=1 Tax=Nocardia rhamnosiphila TaxID=426716 RepID=UPI0022478650|nr:hypothetical protein [Nocardia zapadnayensis]MCX0271059.1 hypothetical protein [Nocardia zapadnayensis]